MNGIRLIQMAACVLAWAASFGSPSDAAPTREPMTAERTAVVHFHEHVSDTDIASFADRHNLDVAYRFQTIPALLIRTTGPREEFVARHRADANVRLIDIDDVLAETGTMPNDPLYSDQYYHENAGQPACGLDAGADLADIDAERAWDLSTGSSSVVVAIVDTGVDIAHPDLAANIFSNPNETLDGVDNDGNGLIDDVNGWDFVEGNNDPSHPVTDNGFHGTRVAGAAGAVGNNGLGLAGASWNVSLMPLRVGTNSSISTPLAAAAIDYAVATGADIINNSWGSHNANSTLEATIAAASNAGVLVVNIAHNTLTFPCGGSNNDVCPIYPANFNYPLNLSVAGTDQFDNLWLGSRFGPNTVHLAVPSKGIRSTNQSFLCSEGADQAMPEDGPDGADLDRGDDAGRLDRPARCRP